MIWLVFSWMLNVILSLDEKDFRGESVFDVRIMVRILLLIFEKVCKEILDR